MIDLKDLREKLKQLPDNDRLFAQVIKDVPSAVVTGFALINKKNDVVPMKKASVGISSVQKTKVVLKEGMSRIEAIQEAGRLDPEESSAYGKIFVTELLDVVRIRTGERGPDAI
ncbi:MAG: hypothetical protein IH993_02290 [Proteobacteria bacterium]|nr:hypothetical protein [Pseudomonadota bacterium]